MPINKLAERTKSEAIEKYSRPVFGAVPKGLYLQPTLFFLSFLINQKRVRP